MLLAALATRGPRTRAALLLATGTASGVAALAAAPAIAAWCARS